MNKGGRKKKDGGIHISDPSCHGNKGLPGSNVKFKLLSESNVKDDSNEGASCWPEKQQSWEVIHPDDDEIYNDAISEVNSPYESLNIYDDATSPNFQTKGDNHITESGSYRVSTHLAETTEIQFTNMTIPNPNKDKTTITLPIPVPIIKMAAEDNNTTSSPESFVPERTDSSERLTASFSAASASPTEDHKIGNPSNKSFDFISSTQSLPPNVHLSTRKLGISHEGDSKEETMERVKMAKRKSLTLRRMPSSSSPPEVGQSWVEVGNIYESVYLSDNPGNPNINNNMDGYDSDDISWSSDEFESYEDSIQNEVAVALQQAQPVTYVGQPPNQSERKSLYGDGNVDPQHPSLLRRIKESFRASPDATRADEDSPLMPVEICDIKHPPPELPPLPTGGLNQNQVKRRLALGVLIESEKSYIASLQRLVDDFSKPLLEIPLLQRGKVRVELMKAKEILLYHQMFQIELAEQVKLWHTQEKIGDVFTASFSKSIVLDAYSEYVNNFTAAMEDIKKVTRQRASLRDFLKSKEVNSRDRLGLFGLMVKPVQRFPQFITCLQDLLKYTPTPHHDRLGLQRALTELENIAHKLNERKRESEQKLEAKVILTNFKENTITRTGLEQNRKLIRVDDLDQVIEASNRFKKRRLILLNDILILATVLPGRDAFEPERYKMKWCYPLKDVEIKESSLSSSMQSSSRDPGTMTFVFAKPENQDEDPFHLVTDLSELHHDYSVLNQVVGLVHTLKRSYTGLSEESVHAVIRDLQRIIHVKDEQLRLVKSCSITLSVPVRTVTGGIGRAKYVFHTQSPTARQDWCLDLQIAKMALDAQNNPGWDVPHQADIMANQMPALFIKALPVDVVRHYTKVRCAVPVFLSTPSNIGVGMQHLWVCNTTDTRGQVSIVSIHSDRPRVIESYQACDCQILCVENVPGYSTIESPYAFTADTVWMVTIQAQVLIYPLTSSDGLTKRQPVATFTLPSTCSTLRYLDDHVFAALDNGQLAVYTRNEDGVWNIASPFFLHLGTLPVRCLLCLESHVLCTTGNWVHFVSLETLQSEISQKLHPDDSAVIGHVARAGVGLWVSYENQPLIHLHHLETLNQLQDVNVSSAIQKALSGKLPLNDLTTLTKDIQVSCLLASKGLLWIGTDKGVVLTLPLPRLREGVPQIGSRPSVSFHGHGGPIRFLLPIFFISPEGDTLKRRTTQRIYDDVPFKIPISDSAKETDLSKQNEVNIAASLAKDNLPEHNVRSMERANSDTYVQESVSEIVEKINKVFPPGQDKSTENPKRSEVLEEASLNVTIDNPDECTTCDRNLLNSQTSETADPSSQTNSVKALESGQGQNLTPMTFNQQKSFNLKSRKSFWKSTPNLAADMEGTEDISVLYGSLMRGLDAPPESTGLRRKMKHSWRGSSGSFTLQPSSSLKEGYFSEKHLRQRKKHGSAQLETSTVYEYAGPLPENEILEEDFTETISTKENISTEESATEINNDTSSVENGTDINASVAPNSADSLPSVANENTMANTVNDIPTSTRRRSDVGEGTLHRQPLHTCKSVIVVSGGDGYCNWNSTNAQKTHKSEEATLILWLHKVIT